MYDKLNEILNSDIIPSIVQGLAVASIGFVIELAKSFQEKDMPRWRIAISRAVANGGLTSSAWVVLVFIALGILLLLYYYKFHYGGENRG